MFTESVKINCSFLACRISKITHMFDISLSFHNSVSGPSLHPPGKCPVMDLYHLSIIVLSGGGTQEKGMKRHKNQKGGRHEGKTTLSDKDRKK